MGRDSGIRWQQNYGLLLCPLWLPLRSHQSVNFLLKNHRLHDQFVMEFLKFSKALEFHEKRLRQQVAGCYGVLTLLSGWGRISCNRL